MAGSSNQQRLIQLELPIAIPHILLGIDQTTMFAFSMVVITAFVGTIEPGQAIYSKPGPKVIWVRFNAA